MEEFKQKIEKNSQELLIIENAKKELLEEKLKTLNDKEKGISYNEDFASLDMNLIGAEEAKLWDEIKNIKNADDFNKASNNLNKYADKIREEMKNDIIQNKFKGKAWDYPKGVIASILGNRLTSLINKFK